MRIIITLALTLLCQVTMPQEVVLTIPDLKKNLKQSFQIVDDSSGNMALFLAENNQIHAYLFDGNLQQIGAASSEMPDSYVSKLAGVQILGNRYQLLLTTGSGRQYGNITFDFDNNQALPQEMDFELEDVRSVDAVVYNNQIHLITISKERENAIVVYKMDEQFNFTSTKISFAEDAFLDRRMKPMSLMELLSRDDTTGSFIEAERIDPEIPNSLESTSKILKIYVEDHLVTIVSDKFDQFTYLIELDLQGMSAEVTRVDQRDFGGSTLGVETNSFLQGDKLFQLATNGKEMNLRMVQLPAGTVVKEYEVGKKDEITFKNGPILKPKSDDKKVDPDKETATLLRKMSSNNTAISVLQNGETYEVTFGGAIERDPTTLILLGGFVGGIGGAVLMGVGFGGLSNSFAAYVTSDAMRTTGLFDANFNHVQGTISEKDFDKIKEYIQELDKIGAATLFLWQGDYFFGYYDKGEDRYQLIRFDI